MSGSPLRLAARIESPRGRQLMRRLLVIDLAVVLVLTLWPRLEVPIPIQRPDLIAHLGVFGSLTLVATAAGLFGRALSNRNILLTALATGIFASVDESLQSIPAIHRTCALDDAMANLLGVSLGAALAWTWQRLSTPRRSSHPEQVFVPLPDFIRMHEGTVASLVVHPLIDPHNGVPD